MGVSGGMEPEDDKPKKLNDDVVVYLSKTEAPRYSARLRAYVDLQRKRSRAAAARRRSEHQNQCRFMKKKDVDKHGENAADKKDENIDKGNESMNKRRGGQEDQDQSFLDRFRSRSRGRSVEPSDRCRRRRRCCCRRRRRRSCRRRRRRSCCRRRRRRSCRRRRRRSRCRRRRRRSCRRRRRRSCCRRRRRRC